MWHSWERRDTRFSTEISEGKRSLGISVHRWEDNIEIGIKEIGREGED